MRTQSISIHLRSQSGSALLVTLLVLVALTVLGIVGINTSSVELSIARNEREARESFYLAEASAMVGVQNLIGTSPADLDRQVLAWHQSRAQVQQNGIDYRDLNHWQTDDRSGSAIAQSPVDPDSFSTAVEWKVAPGGSLIQTQSRLYQNRVYGLCTKNDTGNLVEIGYHMRY